MSRTLPGPWRGAAPSRLGDEATRVSSRQSDSKSLGQTGSLTPQPRCVSGPGRLRRVFRGKEGASRSGGSVRGPVSPWHSGKT